MSSTFNIVAIVGENENGILRQISHESMAVLEPEGYRGHIIDATSASDLARLNGLCQEGIAMAWGLAGVGAGSEYKGQNLWDFLKIPFISVLADPPCAIPRNHFIRSRFVANAYVFKEWLQVQRHFIRSPQHSVLLNSLGVAPNPQRDVIPWRERPQRMTFIKSARNPETRRENWKQFPPRWRAILEDAGATAVQRETGDITDIFVAACESHGLSTEHRKEIVFTLMQELDLYVREYRMTVFATSLLDLPVDIYGRGWDYLIPKTRRARFHSAFDAAHLSAVYAGTQFVLNTSPNISSGIHERVANGLASRCCVVSDGNAFSKKHLADIPTFWGIDINSPDLAAQLAEIYHSPTDYTDTTQIGVDYVARTFDIKTFMQELLQIAIEIKTADCFHSRIPESMAFT